MNVRSEKRGDKHSRRTLARLNAVQALYQLEHDSKSPREVVEEFLLHRVGKELDGDQFKDSDKPLFEDIVLNTAARQEEIDALIAARLEKDRKTDRQGTGAGQRRARQDCERAARRRIRIR